ncbi:MAG: hypothetical protein WBA54_00510 [Acidaminobacteraceae bacterium]
MIFSRLKEKRTFFEYLSKRTIITSILILSSLSVWSILIQTTLKPADEKIIYQVSEVIPIEYEVDLTYISQFTKDAKEAKLERIYSRFDYVINPDGSYIFLSISRDSPKNPKNN